MNSAIKILSYNISHYNYSLYCNNVPLIKSLLLEVEPQELVSEFYGKELCITIRSTPEIFRPYSRYIGITSDGKCDISDIELEMRPHTLENISEIRTCAIDISIEDRNDTFGSLSFTIDLLPYYYWSGFSCTPEYLCSLVTPNQAEIENIVSSAYNLLRDRGELPITDGYEKKNIKKVYAVTRAVYDSIRALKITYNITKTDYLSKYVPLQTCEMLFDRMIGSSLDISLVFAACLENLGLNPLIAIYRNHVLIGCFLSDVTLANPISENYTEFSMWSKASSKIMFFMEPTSMANGMSIDFDNSCRMAKEYFNKNSNSFTALVDIKSARIHGIQPLPNRITENGLRRFEHTERAFDDFFDNLVELNDENTDAIDRELLRMKSEIFDISENNRLINENFHSSIGLAYYSIDSLPSLLAGGMRLVPSSTNIEKELSPEAACALIPSLPALSESEVVAICNEDTLELAWNTIESFTESDKYYRYNTYVTFYYAKWQSPDSSNINYTPMFLFPCEISRNSEKYTIKLLSENAILNPVFLELLNKLFTVNFTALSRIPSREILNRRDYIFSVIASAFNGKNNIKFIPYVALSTYEISSVEDCARLTKGAIEASELSKEIFMGHGSTPNPIHPSDTDHVFPLATPTPLELDHYQKSALLTALQNDASLISGAPNSGKTRIAANIAFNMVYTSKSVLYVGGTRHSCEDMKKYLTQMGIDNYSLFVCPNAPELSGAFEALPPPEKRPSDLYVKAQRLMQRKTEISSYHNALRKKRKNGFDLYHTVMQYEKYKNAKYCVPFTPAFINGLDENKSVAIFKQISEIIKAAKECGLPYRHPLLKIGRKNFSYELKAQAVSLINSYKAALESFLDAQDEICELMCIDFEILREDQTTSIEKLAFLLKSSSEFLPVSLFKNPDYKQIINRISKVVDSAEKRLSSAEQIFALFKGDVLTLDAAEMLSEYKDSLSAFIFKRNGVHKKLLTTLRSYLCDGASLSQDMLSDVLYSLVHYSEHNAVITDNASDFKELFGIDMFPLTLEDEREVLARLKSIHSACGEFISHIENICRRECEPDALIHAQSDVISSYLQTPDIFIRKFSELKERRHEFEEAENTFVRFLNADIYSLKDKMSIKWYEYLYSWITELEQSIDGLKSWCVYLCARDEALRLGLDSAVNLFENTQMDIDEFREAFLKGFFKASCEYVLSSESVLSDFSHSTCVSSCDEISTLVKELNEIIIKDVEIKLHTEYRDYRNSIINDSEEKAYLDSKELGELFASNRKLMQKRFPVTVSYGSAIIPHLSEDTTFDCIIIDDTHAIPYYSLLSLLSHGEKIVFLGTDTCGERILFTPPTMYSLIGRKISRASVSLYSRLEKSSIPHCALPYKYGTRKDLACFVNEVFSSNAEQTVPAASDDACKIEIIPVSGVFDRRGTPINYAEATCVTDILKNASPDENTAVCAFTRYQAALIRDMWNSTGIYNPNIRVFAIEDYPSGTFENVIVSTTFSNSNNTENIPFCPTRISSDNYRHRFNCLLSSVCKNLTVVTGLSENSMDDIDPYTDSLYSIKRFVKFIYAHTHYGPTVKTREMDKNFIKTEICEFLKKLGYQTVRNLGSDKFKIDVAVQKPDGNGFILGILLDNYCGSESDVYTSEILMPELLEKDGWNILRVFTNEWYENYNKQLEKISAELSLIK